MSALPTVTVLIPARNEERDIEGCLRAVLAQDHPHDRMEIVLVDGGSSDRTAECALRVLTGSDVAFKIVDNPSGTTPSNLNAGLRVASGEIICRVDARSIVPTDYVRACVGLLAARHDIAVAGGAQVAIANDPSTLAAGIARGLNNKYAMGGSRYRSGAASGPTDTVYLGAFRAKDLRSVGGWDEYFETNQDFELNRRLGRTGVVWFDDRISVGYVPRQALSALWRQYHRYGRWKVRYWRRTGDRPQPRQVTILAAAGAAVLAGGGFSLSGPRRHRRFALVVAVACGTALVVDDLGSAASAPLGVRAVASAVTVVTGSAWSAGVARELVRSDVAADLSTLEE